MTDKVQKIREEVVRMHNLLPVMDGDNIYVNYADRICTTLEMYIDSLQEEPVSEDLEKVAEDYGIRQGAELKPFAIKFFKAGAKWGKNQARAEIQAQSMALAHGCPKEESVSEDFEKEVRKYASIYYKDNDISKLARHFAKWQKEKDDKLLQDHIVYKKGKESGMRYMKQQMMKDALEAEVTYGKSISIPSLGYFLDKNCLDFGNKVRVIIIKDE